MSLYRCKHCGVRMFEGHIESHLRHRHPGLTVKGLLSNFVRGPRDTSPRPGSQAQTYGRARIGKGGRRRGQVLVTPPDDSVEVADEEPISSLAEIVES